jgi:hypothetical protein
VAALTVIRMDGLMADLMKDHKEASTEFFNSMARYVAVKEEHAELACSMAAQTRQPGCFPPGDV